MKMFGLSIYKNAFETKFGINCKRDLWLELRLLKLTRAIKESNNLIELTDRGAYYWVMAMREFFIAVDTMRDHCRKIIAA
jgi:hypothetical protein